MGKQQIIVYQISDNTKEKMKEFYEDKKREKTPPYAVFQANEADTVITLYESNKVVFQGPDADIDAALWKDMEKHLNNKELVNMTKEKKEKPKDNKDYYFISSIGSDEVGTGDYFGPIVVASSFVKRSDIEYLQSLGIRDSKKITDEKIIEVAPILIKKIPNVIYILNNTDYNIQNQKGFNMNKLKAILHNKVLTNLLQKDNYNYDMIVMDQFAEPRVYFSYLKESSNVVRNINFTTKAEDKCLSVAVSSIIARFMFLKEMKRLSEELHMTLPKGSSTIVDEVGKKIVKQFGEEKLHSIAKLNFKNTNRILEKNI